MRITVAASSVRRVTRSIVSNFSYVTRQKIFYLFSVSSTRFISNRMKLSDFDAFSACSDHTNRSVFQPIPHTCEISYVLRSSLSLSLFARLTILSRKVHATPSSSLRTSPSCSSWYVFHGPSSDSSTVARAVNQATLTFNAGKLHAK